MMISDYLHDVQQQVRRLLEEYAAIYQDVEPDIQQWLTLTQQLEEKIGQFHTILEQENLVEIQQYQTKKTADARDSSRLSAQTADRQPQSPSTQVRMPCQNCSDGEMIVSTRIAPAPQPGHVAIVSEYTCQQCGYHNRDVVYLPKEIALKDYNLEELMGGV